MYCPSCRAEFRAGISRCQNCQVDLVESLPALDVFSSIERMAEALAERSVEPVASGNYLSLTEAQNVLRKARILSAIGSESAEVEVSMHQKFTLLVAKDELDKARAALRTEWQKGLGGEGLEAVTTGQTALDAEHCPACGTPVPPTVEECPECGLFVGVADSEDEA